MYKIITEETGDRYSDTAVFIKLAANGSYVPCEHPEAAGVCVKLPTDFTDEETGETIRMINDTVFVLPDKELTGSEPIAEIEEIMVAMILDDSLTMLRNAEAALIEGVESIG